MYDYFTFTLLSDINTESINTGYFQKHIKTFLFCNHYGTILEQWQHRYVFFLYLLFLILICFYYVYFYHLVLFYLYMFVRDWSALL